MKNENNNLIYGKGRLNGIVSVEDKGNGFIEVFTQDNAGKVSSQDIPYEYWLLTHRNADRFSKRLAGNGHYLYKNPFSLREDFEYAKRCLRKEQAMGNAFWINDIKEQFMVTSGETYYKGLKYSEVSVLSFDIETTGLEHNDESKVLLISNTFRDARGKTTRKLFAYDEYNSDKEMFEAWCAWVREQDPSVIITHNGFGFDLPYLDFCASKYDMELNLGRNGKAIRFNGWTSKFRKEATQMIDYTECHIYGREVIDSMFISIKMDVGRNFSSYGLKSLIKELGLEQQDRVYYDASLIRKNYMIPKEWGLIKKYCEHDSDEALALWDMFGAPSFYWCQSVPKSLQKVVAGATGSQINSIMMRNYFQEGHSLPKASEVSHFEGGISLGIPGNYRNCLKVDILSAYPSTILAFNIYDPKKDPKGYFLKIVEHFFLQRKEYKRLAKETKEKYYIDMDATFKIAANSMYGTLSTNGLLFNFPAGAAMITEKCREYIETAVKWATNQDVNYWKYKSQSEIKNVI